MNSKALNGLKFEDLSHSFECLKEAEKYLLQLMQQHGSHELLCKLLSVTLNNLACYHKKKGYLRTSLKYFGQILSIEKFYLKDTSGVASTYLNVSTVLDQLNKTKEALQFAKKAMNLLADQLGIRDQFNSHQSCASVIEEGAEKGVVIKSLMTATVNVATMLLKVGSNEQAFQVSNRGIQHSRDLLGPNHYLEQRLKEIKDSAGRKLQGQYSRKRVATNFQTTLASKRELEASSYHCKDSVYDPYMRPQSAYTWEVVLSEKKGVSLNIDRVKGEISLGGYTIGQTARPKSRLKLSSKSFNSRDARVRSERSVQEISKETDKIMYRPCSTDRSKDQDRLKVYKIRATSTEPKQRKLKLTPVNISSVNQKESNTNRYRTQLKPRVNSLFPTAQPKSKTSSVKMERPYSLLELTDSKKESRPSIDILEKLRSEEPLIPIENQKLLNFDQSFEALSGGRKKSLAPIDEQSNEEMRSRELGVKDIQFDDMQVGSSRLAASTKRKSKTNKT